MQNSNSVGGTHMIVREIQKNETVKFRVPGKVAEQIRLIKTKCKELDWKFELNDEIAKLIEKQCRIAFDEIQTELDHRKQESTCDDVDVEMRTESVRSRKLAPSTSKPLPILIPGKGE